jgi:hypothetical protein
MRALFQAVGLPLLYRNPFNHIWDNYSLGSRPSPVLCSNRENPSLLPMLRKTRVISSRYTRQQFDVTFSDG